MREMDTITAIATPQGIGALAVIRVSGNNSHQVFQQILSEKEKFSKEKNRVIAKYTVVDKTKTVDEITAIKYVVPHSYTGENMIELFCHGGNFTTHKIIELLIKNGARIADRGEFTKRAYINGKIDLMKAESVQAIIESNNSIEHQIAIEYYKQKNQIILNTIKNSLQKEISTIEAEIEFQDEEQNDVESMSSKSIQNLIITFKRELEKREKIHESNKGMQILLLGPTNAGKSSLFNEILGSNRAIVSNIHGTTRDSISENIIINKRDVIIIDTAGIRKSDDLIEIEGQKRTIEKINEADMLIWLTDSSTDLYIEEKETFLNIDNLNPLVILNKTDLNKNREKEDFYYSSGKQIVEISLKTKTQTDVLLSIIEAKVEKHTSSEDNSTYIMNQRQQSHFKEILSSLVAAENHWNQKEIAAYYLKKALDEIDVLTGKTENDEIINRIFETFCIGK